MLIMLEVKQLRQDRINNFVESRKSSKQQAREQHSFISLLRLLVDDYLTIIDRDSRPSLIDFFFKLRAYRLKIYNSTNVAEEAK